MRRTNLAATLLALAAAAFAPRAHATDPPDAGASDAGVVVDIGPPANTAAPDAAVATAGGGFQLRPIDRATVRLVSITGVGGEQVQGRTTGIIRTLAVPDGGHGSGVLVRGDGVVMTARHVIADALILAAVFPGEDRARPARVIYSDPEHDVAFLAVEGPTPQFLPMPAGTPPMHAAEHVSVSGYPIDATQRDPAATSGEIARRMNDGRLELAMALNPGNSGGPVIDDAGNLVGVVTEGGDPSRGVQGIVIAEPIDVILRDWQASVEHATLPRFDGPGADVDRDVAQLALQIVTIGTTALAFDTSVRDRLASLAARSPGPAVQLLIAAQAWNALGVLLETRGADALEALPADARPEGDRLWRTALGYARAIVAADPTARRRYPFLAAVLGKAEASDRVVGSLCGREGNACCADNGCNSGLSCNASSVCTALVRCGPDAPCGRGYACEAHVCRPVRGPERVSFAPLVGLAMDDGAGATTVYGGLLDFAVLAHIYTFGARRPFELDVLAGGDFGIGSWRQNVVADVDANAGLRVRLGSPWGAELTALYTPGYILAEGRGAFAWAAYRLGAGLHYNDVSFGLTWQEQGRYADSTFRLLGLYAEFGY